MPPSPIHPLRLPPGNDLREELQRYVDTHDIRAGWVVTCVGSLTDYHLRFANQPEGTRGTGHFEIVSLVGTLSTNGSHLHISLSDETGKTIGGHLLEGNLVYTTAEIVLGESTQHEFVRVHDGTTPYKELGIREQHKD